MGVQSDSWILENVSSDRCFNINSSKVESKGTVEYERNLKSGLTGIKPIYSSIILGIKSPLAYGPLWCTLCWKRVTLFCLVVPFLHTLKSITSILLGRLNLQRLIIIMQPAGCNPRRESRWWKAWRQKRREMMVLPREPVPCPHPQLKMVLPREPVPCPYPQLIHVDYSCMPTNHTIMPPLLHKLPLCFHLECFLPSAITLKRLMDDWLSFKGLMASWADSL